MHISPATTRAVTHFVQQAAAPVADHVPVVVVAASHLDQLAGRGLFTAEHLANDPHVTRDVVFERVAMIVAKPDEQITREDLRELATLQQITGDKQPGVPRSLYCSFASVLHSDRDDAAREAVNEVRLWVGAERFARDPAVTRESVFERIAGIAAKPDEQITREDLRELATLQQIAGDKQPGIPTYFSSYAYKQLLRSDWLPSNAPEARKAVNEVRAWVGAERLARDPTVTRESVFERIAAIVAKPNEQLTHEDTQQLAAFQQLTGDKQPGFPQTTYHFPGLLAALSGAHGDANNAMNPAHLAVNEVRTWVGAEQLLRDSVVTRESAFERVATIIAKPDEQIAHEDMLQLMAIERLTQGEQTALPRTSYSFTQLLGEDRLPSNDRYARMVVDEVRSWMSVERLVRDPAVTRDVVLERIAAIVTKPDEQITREDLSELATLQHITGDKQPGIPTSFLSFAQLLSKNKFPSNNYDARRAVNEVRAWAGAEQLLRDPAVTRESVFERVAAIVAKPDQQITREDLLQLAALQQLTGYKQPGIPNNTSCYFIPLLDGNRLPSNDRYARAEVDVVRAWVARERRLAEVAGWDASKSGAAVERLERLPGSKWSSDDVVVLDELLRSKYVGGAAQRLAGDRLRELLARSADGLTTEQGTLLDELVTMLTPVERLSTELPDVSTSDATHVRARLRNGIGDLYGERELTRLLATWRVQLGVGFAATAPAALRDGPGGAHLITRDQVAEFVKESVHKEAVYHGASNAGTYRSVLENGPLVEKNKRSAWGQGFYTALTPGGWGRDLEIALDIRNPLTGTPDTVRAALDALQPGLSRQSSAIRDALIAAGYDSIVLHRPPRDGGDWIVTLHNHQARIVTDTTSTT